MSIAQMRILISTVYDNWTWRAKVEKMPDRQVAAIYHKFLSEGRFDRIKDTHKTIQENNYRQMTIADFM